MSQASQLSPELARGLLQLARALLAAARNWTLYPPEHPTVAASVSRLSDAIRQSTLGAIFSIGITPETLMVESTPADSSQSSIAEAAALLHDRDLLRMTFIGDVPPEAVHALLRVLSLDPAERRRRGGPAVIWAAESQPTLVLEQIDYEKVLARDEGDVPEPAKRDALWQSIVTSIAGGQTAMFDQLSQERLLAIAGSPRDIGALAVGRRRPEVRDGRLADDHVSSRDGPCGVPPPRGDRVRDVSGSRARGDEQPGHRLAAARSSRRDAGAADGRRSQVRALHRQGSRRGVRRCEGGAAAGDGSGARGTGVRSAGDHIQYDRPR